MKEVKTSQVAGKKKVVVNTFTNGILDPEAPMLGPLMDGGIIKANTAPGCWGPMITPSLKGGHEVTQPVYIENSGPGDAVVIRINKIEVTSLATASGHDSFVQSCFLGDPYVAKRCPKCNIIYPRTREEGIGQNAIRCINCGTPVTPFKMEHGYTVVFDKDMRIGVTMGKSQAEKIARTSRHYAMIPEHSIQHSILIYAPHNLVGTVSRLRPFLGQLGTLPAIKMPDSHNAGDFGTSLIGAPHEFALTEEQLELRTDGHMDIDIVREGAIVVAPIKVAGGGIYLGDMHALQGDGEIAGHTMDVAGLVELQIQLMKNRKLEGPVIFPLIEDLPFLAKPFTEEEKAKALSLSRQWGVDEIEKSAPISIVGTGANLNIATENGLDRAAKLLGMSIPEVRNRSTINGAIEIGRLPGVVQVTFLAPLKNLKNAGFLDIIREQYNII